MYADRTVENRQEAGLTGALAYRWNHQEAAGAVRHGGLFLNTRQTHSETQLLQVGCREAANAYINVDIIPAKPMGWWEKASIPRASLLKKRPKGGWRRSHVNIWGKSILGRVNSKYKGPEMRMFLSYVWGKTRRLVWLKYKKKKKWKGRMEEDKVRI